MTREREKTLIRQAQEDPRAFATIFDAYYQEIFGHIYRRVLDLEVAKDICSEVFYLALRHLGSFRWRGISIAAWLHRIARNEINAYFRSKRTRRRYVSSLNHEHRLKWTSGGALHETAAEQAEKMDSHAEFRLIQTQLKRLSIKYQEVIALRYFEEKSIKEICEILNKKEGTVKSLLSRGLDKLRVLVQNA